MEFFDKFEVLLVTARETGVRTIPPADSRRPQPFETEFEIKAFVEACHSGFANAQRQIVELIEEVAEDASITRQAKAYRTLLLRRVADHIAWTMFALEGHAIRRLALQDDPPSLDLATIKVALMEADERNDESGLTFSLVADLTTFVHVADLVSIDFRPSSPIVSFTELKSGSVNEILLEKLEDYEPTDSVISAIASDPDIKPQHRKQAQRMLRQRMRLAQVEEVLNKDEGTDIRFKKPIRVQPEYIETTSYGDLLGSLCERADQFGVAGGLGGWCVHIGIGTGSDREESQKRAENALNQAINIQWNKNPPRIKSIAGELETSHGIKPEDQVKVFDLLSLNLGVIVGEPFTLWPIRSDLLRRIVEGSMTIAVGFDLAAFIWLGEELGYPIEVASRKETGRAVTEFGSRAIPRWGGRAVALEGPSGRWILAGGMLSRFLVNLVEPASFLAGMKSAEKNEKEMPSEVT